jgi:hypothetical protein
VKFVVMGFIVGPISVGVANIVDFSPPAPDPPAATLPVFVLVLKLEPGANPGLPSYPALVPPGVEPLNGLNVPIPPAFAGSPSIPGIKMPDASVPVVLCPYVFAKYDG